MHDKTKTRRGAIRGKSKKCRSTSVTQRMMGEAFLFGKDDSDNLAMPWFMRGAKEGDAEALYLLGEDYREGNVNEQNNFCAYVCYDLAVTQGRGDAEKKRDEIEKANLMTPAQIRVAKRMAEKCRKQYYENCKKGV